MNSEKALINIRDIIYSTPFRSRIVCHDFAIFQLLVLFGVGLSYALKMYCELVCYFSHKQNKIMHFWLFMAHSARSEWRAVNNITNISQRFLSSNVILQFDMIEHNFCLVMFFESRCNQGVLLSP